jgi:C-terminal processing protease CtpA/Prc
MLGLILIAEMCGIERLVYAEEAVGQLTREERIFGLAKIWSEVKYNFANFDLVPDLDWDKAFQEYLPKAAEQQSDAEYYRLLRRFVSLLRDGHTEVSPPAYIQRMIDMPAVSIENIEGKGVIVDLAEGGELARAGICAGAEITRIDGRAVSEVIEQDMYPFIAASTPQARDAEAYGRILRGPKGSRVVVDVRDLQGNVRTVTLTRDSGTVEAQRFYGGRMQRPGVEMRRLPGGVVYFALNSFGFEQVVADFDKMFEGLADIGGMIIDVRHNGGGNSGYGDAIIGRLTDRPLAQFTAQLRQRISGFGEFWLKAGGDVIQPRGDSPFLGPLVVLTSRHTASAAEDFVVVLHGNRRAVVVGGRTCGSTGQPVSIDLPGGGSVRICAKKCFYPDGRPFVGVGVIPDVEAHLTQKDVAVGRDAVLEEGLEVLKSKMGGVSAVETAFRTTYTAVAEGDYYGRHGQLSNAIDSYKEALELEPNSVTVHLKLAGIYRQQSNEKEALKHYNATGFLQDDAWMVIGPFENNDGVGFDAQYPPEKGIDFAGQYSGKEGNVRWFEPEHKQMDGFMNLASVLKPNEWTVAYAATRLYSPDARNVHLRIGSDDEVKVWLNGELVLNSNVPRFAAMDQDIVHVNLRSGTNEILVKVCNRTGSWGFYMRVTDVRGQRLTDLHPVGW